jgi:predicted kinase
MRQLYLLRGNVASGKSTWLEKHGLTQYALCADTIRLLLQSPVLMPSGKYGITQENDKRTWELLFEMLQTRMERGELVFIDATHSKSSDFAKYKKLAEAYRYRIFCLDFTDVPLELCVARNNDRSEYKQVPLRVLENIDARLKSQPTPSYATVVKPDRFADFFEIKPLNFDQYKAVTVIGDIHGCYEPLSKIEFKDDEFYIFVGDYIDRGIQNAKVIGHLLTLHEKPNILLLEGNHERWLRFWSNNETDNIRSNEFKFQTRPELDASGLDKSEIRQLCRKFAQMAYFTYRGRTVLITHGGISSLPGQLVTIATEQFIKGVGKYEDMLEVADSWSSHSPENSVQLSGHRNVTDSPIQVNSKYYNLEGKVEFGGELRVVVLRGDGSIEPISYPNTIFRPKAIKVELTLNPSSFVEDLRRSKFIHERACGDISSFNFSRQAFYKKLWDGMTVKARGLFVNTKTNEIVARSYNKFFNLGERDDQRVENIQFEYPVTAWEKYNGFLGMVGYDTASDSLLYLSKSSVEGIYPEFFKGVLFDALSSEQLEKIKEELKSRNICLVFECIDIKNDPHIIEYERSEVRLLDIVRRTLDYEKLPYEDVVAFAKKYNLPVKKTAQVMKSQEGFMFFMNTLGVEETDFIEGYVLEDSNGLMVKIKLPYYNFWKHMRALKDAVRGRKQVNLAALTSLDANYFYQWCKTRTGEELSRDIITLRKMFYKERGVA